MTPLVAGLMGVAVGLLFTAIVACLVLLRMLRHEQHVQQTLTAFGQVTVRLIARVHDLELGARLDAKS